VIERYASRWSIEVAIEDARQVFGSVPMLLPVHRHQRLSFPRRWHAWSFRDVDSCRDLGLAGEDNRGN
jgi:hypothetical protein